MNTKTIGVLVGVLAFLAVGFFVGKVFSPSTPPLGNSSSPSVIDGCMDVNGVTTCYTRRALVLATSTPCAIKSPAATSTLLRTTLAVTTATTTAVTWTIATSTTAFATTTVIADPILLASGLKATIGLIASTTAAGSQIDGTYVISPNTYIVWGAKGFFPASTKLAGVCQAVFEVI